MKRYYPQNVLAQLNAVGVGETAIIEGEQVTGAHQPSGRRVFEFRGTTMEQCDVYAKLSAMKWVKA